MSQHSNSLQTFTVKPSYIIQRKTSKSAKVQPDVTNRTKSNVRLINSIQLNRTQSRDWVRLSSVIEHNQLSQKNLTSRTQSNVRVSSIEL